MADGIIDNLFLINAPAGSGKTTSIRNRLKAINLNDPKSKVLCITYTNRAVEELQKDLNNKNIYVSTIHSYIHNLISPFFAEKQALELYWTLYRDKIIERIQNITSADNITESNQKYIDSYGGLSEDIIRANLKKLSYNEMQFTSLYYGGLSHDDLLKFAYILSEKYPVILKKIYGKFKYIFIDEYQDTSADILRLFYNAVKNKNAKLYLFGDRMQQIYNNYDGSFNNELKEFNASEKLVVNHRSLPQIISILNKLYNDKNYNQDPSEKNKEVQPDYNPEIVIASNMDATIKKIQLKSPSAIILYLLNREKYNEIGAEALYRSFSDMDKYSFGRKYSPTDVLSDMTDDNPDLLMEFLFTIYKIEKLYSSENFGSIISLCKKKYNLINQAFLKISSHRDKIRLRDSFEKLIEKYEKDETTIGDILHTLVKLNITTEEVVAKFNENIEYSEVLDISIKEIRNLATYLDSPSISTQHGVKGESHTSVVFVVNDSNNNPVVRMYDFFELWSNVDFSLPQIEDLYYSYLAEVNTLTCTLGMKTSNLNVASHNNNEINKEILRKACERIVKLFEGNKIFEFSCKKDYETYLSNPNVGNAKKTFITTRLYGVLSAYRLFYVGCSRARKNLTIIIDNSRVGNFKDAFIKKARDIGFIIQET